MIDYVAIANECAKDCLANHSNMRYVEVLSKWLLLSHVVRFLDFQGRNLENASCEEIDRAFEDFGNSIISVCRTEVKSYGKKISQKTAALAESAQAVTTD